VDQNLLLEHQLKLNAKATEDTLPFQAILMKLRFKLGELVVLEE
jgi:hypothetical protein